ncbi:MAG: hypothetical protein E7371_02520 [Clostridiales bacterium]|nr:hypothetical protein [Clostridiales bacterium]
MKKSLQLLLLSLASLCLVGAVACKDNDSSSDSVESTPSYSSPDDSESADSSSNTSSEDEKKERTLKVNFTEGDGYSFETDFNDGYLAYEGEAITFRVKKSVFYDGSPVVKLNGEAQSHEDGLYTVTITEDSEITVEGIYKAVSALSTGTAGTGAFDDAFVVSKPIDLVYIAEQVNKGVYEYVTGAYILANDIDCGGEELEIIGDMSTENSFFSGCFTCYTDPETNTMVPATISNFVINSENANYVGLFGTVYNDLSVTSSGLFYGINLANFTINASLSEDMMSANRSISVGGLIGYGVGANVYVCSATDAEINVYGDNNYFAFAGGLVGYQQAFYATDYDMYFSSEIVYSHTDVNIRVLRGMCLYAGGISGYLATNVPSGATAFIHNSYANGNVSGALRAGGIAGGLGQYTSVGNCYATGTIFARANQSLDDVLLTDDQYCYANAGGIAGYAENDTIVSDCFFAGSTSANAASAGCSFTHDIIGGGYEKAYTSSASEKYTLHNCLTKDQLLDSKTENTTLIQNTLAWNNADWDFANQDSDYPTINYNMVEGNVINTITFEYVSNGTTDPIKVKNQTSESIDYFNSGYQSNNIYAPMGNYFITESFDRMLKADNGFLSYGYFFDKECTQKVPYAFVPQKNMTLYIGFADPTAILGEYQLTNGNSLHDWNITFDEDGYATYTDGKTTQTSYYFFDGTNILIEGARLARYYDGEIIVDENDTSSVQDANFDLARYNYYDFVGVWSENGLVLYDGTYFTADNPLNAYRDLFRGEYYTADGTVYKFFGATATAEHGATYTEYTYVKNGETLQLTDTAGNSTTLNINDLTELDNFKGSWTKSATINKTYTFDGMGKWTYEYVSYERVTNGYAYTYEKRLIDQASGTYTNNAGTLTLSNGATVSFNADGELVIEENAKQQIYYQSNSYVGVWQSSGLTVTLDGIGKSGYGNATLSYNGTVYNLVYEASETEDYVCLYWAHDVYTKDALFGYFTYDLATNTLLATISDANNVDTGYTQGNLFIVDDYIGEWICDAEEFQNVEFTFNGNGLYGFLYGYDGMEGQVTLRDLTTDKKTTLTYTLDSSLRGYFSYNGTKWQMEYDEDLKAVILTVSGKDDAHLQRKDELANTSFVDNDGNTYSFDGRSNLTEGGKLTVNGTTVYTYHVNDAGWIVKDNGTQIGEILLSADKTHYTLTLNSNDTSLYLFNEFIGKWAIGGEFSTFEIGPTDLNGNIQAVFKGHNVQLSTVESNLLTFKYRENNMPITYYVFVIEDEALGYDVLVLSQYTNLYSGDYAICTKAIDLFGEWVGKSFTLRFDGIESGSYAYGYATLSRGSGQTDYSYRYSEHGTVMWSQAVLGGKYWYYDIKTLSAEEMATLNVNNLPNDVFVKTDKDGNITAAIKRISRDSVDDLLFANAKDNKGSKYFFYGNNINDEAGDLYVNGTLTYSYKIVNRDEATKTFTLELTELSTGKVFNATVNFTNSTAMTIAIGAEITPA